MSDLSFLSDEKVNLFLGNRKETQLFRSINLIKLISHDLGHLPDDGNAFICPFHEDHNPSLVINTNRNLWRCFGSCYYNQLYKNGSQKWFDTLEWCQVWQHKKGNETFDFIDAKDYLREFLRENKCDILEQPKPPAHSPKITDVAAGTRQARPILTPSVEWQNEVNEKIDLFSRYLFLPVGRDALDWLHERGLNDDTLRRYSIGFNDVNRYQKGHPFFPKGIYIPNYWNDTLMTCKVRVNDYANDHTEGKKKYTYIARKDNGSKIILYYPEFGKIHLFVESEFDCLLLRQEFNGMISVNTFGAAGFVPDYESVKPFVENANVILVCLDTDDKAGVDGSKSLASLPGFQIAPIRHSFHDFTKMIQRRGDVVQWLCDNLEALNTGKIPFYWNSNY